MDKIVSIFRPYLDAIPTTDIVPTKLGWVMVEVSEYETKAALLQTEDDLLQVLAGISVDAVEGVHHTRTTARMARAALAPYLGQLPPDQVRKVDLALEVYARLDDLAP